MRIRALLIMLTLIALTGCVQLPKPVSPEEAPRPAMTMAEAVSFQRELITTLKKTDAKSDTVLPASVLVGPDLSARRAAYYDRKTIGTKVDPLESGSAVVQVFAGATTGYPRQAVIVCRRTPTKGHRDDRAIYLVTRADAGSPWLRAFGVTTTAKILATTREPMDGISQLPPGRLNGSDLRTTDDLKRALSHPQRLAKRWEQTPALTGMTREAAELRKADLKVVNIVASQQIPTGVVPTNDGGAFVLANVSLIQTLSYGGKGDGFVTFGNGYPLHKRFSGDYETVTRTFTQTYLYRVLPRGKITVSDVHSSPTDVVTTPDR